MSIVLSFGEYQGRVWAAGPEGFFELGRVPSGRDASDSTSAPISEPTPLKMEPVLQPMQNLYCCAAIHDRLLVGGLPHGVAYLLGTVATGDLSGQASTQSGEEQAPSGRGWQAGWMDNVDAPVLSLAPDPMVINSGVILAGTDSGGILRTINRGGHWYTRNFGLRTFTILALQWAPPAPAGEWPIWQMVFAATEEGVYHSPNGGRGWKRSETPEAVYQSLAVAPDYHASGLVLAGTEGDGLFRSVDGGHTFTPVPDAPKQINALTAVRRLDIAQGQSGAGALGAWFLSDENQVWQSPDGLSWTPVPGSQAALVLHPRKDHVLAGHEAGVTALPLAAVVT
jgi:hypothetical protein